MTEPGGAKGPILGLALGSGAIRGLAHIGVLRVLQQAGVTPGIVVGSSAGALVGALYCIGADLHLLESFVAHLSWRQLADFSVGRKGLVRGDKVLSLLRILTKGQDFRSCRYDFTAITTDLYTGERVLIREGSLADAVRASISIPGIFSPFEYMSRTLVDGGIVGRVPAATARELGADIVVGVDVNMGIKPMAGPYSIFEVILQSIDIMQAEVLKASMADADIVIAPAVGSVGPLELSKAREIVAAGEAAARAALPQVLTLIGGVRLED